MREILFRGKRVDNGEWVEGVPIVKYGNLYISVPEMSFMYITYNQPAVFDFITRVYQVDPETVGQYTCLNDKNGKKIFEGDILRSDIYPYHSRGFDNYYAEISYFEDNASFGITTHKNPKSAVNGISDGNTDYIEEYDLSDFEIIGNIHDNPELVEGECLQE